jgi:DNA modification methylase
MNNLARFYFKLRQNIDLEGDILLARLELEALMSVQLENVPSMANLERLEPASANLKGLSKPSSHCRTNGVQGFAAHASVTKLSRLIKCLSFIERIFCFTENDCVVVDYIDQVQRNCGNVLRYYQKGGTLLIEAIPHFAIFEFSQTPLMRSKTPGEVKKNLDLLLTGLFGKTNIPQAKKIVIEALKAKNSSSLLSHDIHYYKAKFFPRMVRALINIGSNTIDGAPLKVIDNFVGSGTTLLEAATLGFESMGIDLDPLSVLISNTKIEVLNYDSSLLGKEYVRIIDEIEMSRSGQRTLLRDPQLGKYLSEKELFPEWLLKNRKMTADVASELVEDVNLLRLAQEISTPEIRELVQVLISDAITRKVKMRILGTGSGRFSLSFAKTPLLYIFSRSLRNYVKVAAVAEWLKEVLKINLAPAKAIIGDARCLPKEVTNFDILVTSPPYLPASSGRESYAKARAISLRALGVSEVDSLIDDAVGGMNGHNIDLSQLSEKEMEVVTWLAQDELRRVKAEPTARYFLDMRQSFNEMYRVLNRGAFVALVSGKQNTFYKFSTREVLYVVPTVELLAGEAQKAGFDVENLIDVQLKKSNRNARPRSLDDYYETVVILRKP